MRTLVVLTLVAFAELTVCGQFLRPNSDGHFQPVIANSQNLGAMTNRFNEGWLNVLRLKGTGNQMVVDANFVGQRSTIIFENQMTNIGAFTFRNGTMDNWYISGYGGLGESYSDYTGLETNSFLFGEQDGDIFTGRAGSTFYLTNSFYMPGQFIVPGFAVQSLLAAGTIVPTNFNILVEGDGAARILTSSPSIVAPTIDTFIILTGNSDVNTLTLQDESISPGSLLRLQATTRTLGLYDKIGLLYSVAHSVWEEVFFSPGAGGGGGGAVSDTSFGASWNGETATSPSQNALYDWGHIFDTDDDGLPNVLEATFTFSGFSISGDGDGAITLLGAGNGADEDLTLNLDDTANNAVVTSSTGLTNISLTAINLTVPATPYDATAWDGNSTVPTRDDIRDVIEAFGDIDNSVYSIAWDGSTDAPSMNAVFDKIEALPSDTATFTGKTFDAAGTGNVLKQIKSFKFNFPRLVDGTGCTLPNTNDFTAATFMVPNFSGTGASNANFMRFGVRIPTDIDTSVDLTARLTVELTGADTAAHIYHLGMVSIAASAAIAGTAANYVVVNVAADASGASGDVESSASTTLTGWAAAVTAGNWWLIELRRNGADTSTVASRFQELEIFYTSTQ